MPAALSRFIDAARWIAALAVLLTHSGVLISLSDIMVAPHGPGVYLWWFSTAFAHQAVVVFFVISGFLVGGKVLELLRRPTPFLRNYLIDRFCRIYVVFGPVLVLGFFFDMAGRRLFAGSGIYELPALEGVFAPIHMLTAFLQLQCNWASQAGTNGALWSLSCEFWYYVIFPLLLLGFSRAYSQAARIAGFVCGFCLAVFLSIPGGFFLFGFGIWALGAFVTRAKRPLIASKWLSLLIFLATAAAIRLAVRGPLLEGRPYLQLLADAATAATFANLLLTLRFCEGHGFSFCRASIHRRLSNFSYSLYATHMPILFFFWAGTNHVLGKDWHKLLPTPLHWSVAFALIATSLAIGYGFSTLTEAKTDALRGVLRDLFAKLDRLARGSIPVRQPS